MGNVVGTWQHEERDERREAQRGANRGFFVACCYTPRKPPPGGVQTLSLPRCKILSKTPGTLDLDTDSDLEVAPPYSSGTKLVRFPSPSSEAVFHTWVEDDPEWAEARRSSDIDWEQFHEKVANVRRIGDTRVMLTLPTTFTAGVSARQRAQARRRQRLSLRAMENRPEDTAAFGQLWAEGIMKDSHAVECQSGSPGTLPRWSPKELETWNTDHIKCVISELFEIHDIGRKGRLSWQKREVMAFVRDFFLLHDCPHPKLPSVVFSSAYNQVKVDSIPSHQDIDGLDMAETCEFARRVYDFIVNGLAGEIREQRRLSGSISPEIIASLGSHESSSNMSGTPIAEPIPA